jgi:hypothetical protein
MMDFNNVLNRVLQEDPEGRRRALRLRTYSVTCLNEECGLLEWVYATSRLIYPTTSPLSPASLPLSGCIIIGG